ncbi:SigE family RNA polymerase sigma factor [Geodermatophilus marinus]|uniref:hypothetical protein n=1 Tax=Geodermatophilus sp. LHW52908 TaxID=2303986 RepID=UPI000E3B6228|nr:hypothetical protein [Geodermatophilus sp. LHW52908]RFU21585.1 hypothetical protein D0Z06_10325 [Geodermatophilus sp. LHW52908]
MGRRAARGTAADGDLQRAVAAELPALLRTAWLLTGDTGRAEELVQVALSRAVTRGRLAEGAALEALLDAAAGRRGRAGQALVPADDGFPDGGLTGGVGDGVAGGPLARVLPDLPPHRRADVLGRAAAGPRAGPARWRLSDEAAVADLLRRRRRTRRWRVGVAGAAVAALAVGALLVAPGRGTPPGPPAGATAAAPAGPSAPPDPSVPVLAGPTRGSLAGDAAFLAAVREAGWGARVAPSPDRRTVVYAGDTPHGRAALLVGRVDDDLRGVWLTGPPGADPAELAPFQPPALGPGRPAPLLLGGPGPASLVVVAAPGDAVEVSDRLQVGPRGTVGRTYRPVADAAGVAVVPVTTTAGGTGVSVRVTRDGREVWRSGVGGPRELPPPEAPDLEPLRPGGTPPADRVLAQALREIAVPLGVEPEVLEPVLLWAGRFPLDEVPGTAVVVVGRSPGGGLVVTTWAAQVGPAGAGRAVPCGVQTPPGTTEVSRLVVARVCDLSEPEREPSPAGRWLVVTAPDAAASMAVLDRRGAVLGTAPLEGGSAALPLPEGARTVRTRDATGAALAEVAVAAAPSAPFGDYGPGPAG